MILDPRYKFDFVNTTFDDMYDDPQLFECMKKKMRDSLFRLYERYSIESNQQDTAMEQTGDSSKVTKN